MDSSTVDPWIIVQWIPAIRRPHECRLFVITTRLFWPECTLGAVADRINGVPLYAI